MKVIYIATPYTNDDFCILQKRYFESIEACKYVLDQGYCPFSPIVNYHPIAMMHKTEIKFDAWEEIDFEMISRSDEIWVFKFEGWNQSIGIKKEINFSRKINKKIKFIRMK